MRKPVVLLLITVGVILGLGLAWIALFPPKKPTNNTNTTNSNSSSMDDMDMSSHDTMPSDSTPQEVVMKGLAFTPAKLTVKKGTQVTWTNQDDAKHNVVADDEANGGGLPGDASLLSKGQSYSHTFDTVGSFAYHCSVHPNMKGVIEVTE